VPRAQNDYQAAADQGRLWTPQVSYPASVLRANYDISDRSTISASGGVIDQVRDKSGNGLHVSATATARPALTDNEAIFDGVNDQLVTASNLGIFGAAARTVFYVARRISTDPSNGQPVFFWGAESTRLAFGSSSWDVPGGFISVWAWASDVNIHPGTANSYIGTAFFTGTVQGGFVNGGTATTLTSALNTTNSVLYLGRRLGRFAGVALSEIHILNQYLPAWEMDRFAGYLAWKWRYLLPRDLVGDLPGRNPFKNRPPLIGG